MTFSGDREMERDLAKLLFATAIIVVFPTTASAQALLSDQTDMMAHMANAALAAEVCGMRIDQEVLDGTMAHIGLASEDTQVEPYRSAFERAANEAQISVEALGSEAVCERLDLMYGPTGFRIPGVLAR